jgi:Ca-activated chloride channel family protein
MAASDLQELDADPAVAEQLALLKANRERRRAIEQLDLGDFDAADSTLASAAACFSAMPASDLTTRELKLLQEKRALLWQDRNLSRKRLSRESLRSKSIVWAEDEDGTT